MAATYRGIVESDLYREAKDTLPVTCQRLDEMLHGITWVLARKPDEFPRVHGSTLHRARTEDFPGLPVFLIWFTFDQDTVTLQLIEHWTEE